MISLDESVPSSQIGIRPRSRNDAMFVRLTIFSALLLLITLGDPLAEPQRHGLQRYIYRLADGTPVVFSTFKHNEKVSLAIQVGDAEIVDSTVETNSKYAVKITGDSMNFVVPVQLRDGMTWELDNYSYAVESRRTMTISGIPETVWTIGRTNRQQTGTAYFVWSECHGLLSFSENRVQNLYSLSSGKFENVLAREGYWLDKLPGLGAKYKPGGKDIGDEVTKACK